MPEPTAPSAGSGEVAIPPQGAYAAKRCPLRVQFDVVPPGDVVAVEPSAVGRLRMDDGLAHEREVFAELALLHPDAVVIDGGRSRPEREAETVAAMAAGAALVIAGRLPADRVGLRVGEPDLLVRAEERTDGSWAYHPVDVKHHRAAKPLAESKVAPEPGVASFDTPAFEQASTAAGWKAEVGRDDLLQLAHYHRMLEAAGHASDEPVAGIIGKQPVVAWTRLDEPAIRHTWHTTSEHRQSALDRYDHEFAFRLDVLRAAACGEPIVEPISIPECPSCPWVAHCKPRIEAADSTSLIPGYGYPQWHALRRRGITSRAELATLDERTAALLATWPGDLNEAVDWAHAVGASTPVDELVEQLDHLANRKRADDAANPGNRADAAADSGDPQPTGADAAPPAVAPPGPVLISGRPADGTPPLQNEPDPRLALLAEFDVTTAGDLLVLDERVLRLADAPLRGLVDAIRGARVITGDGRPVLRYGIDELMVPRADVEIDIDMESAIDQTAYLWGALVNGRYEAVASWDETSPEVEADVFLRFWAWLGEQRTVAGAAGQSVAVYCWSKQAESGALRNGAAAAEALGHDGMLAEVDEWLAGPELIDLLVVFRDQICTGRGNGLKVVAPLAGFAWRDDEPGGEISMLWHHDAVSSPDPAVRAATRERLLAYNEDDVRATAAVREWLASGAITSP
jgi:predicted RecB family nuclease